MTTHTHNTHNAGPHLAANRGKDALIIGYLSHRSGDKPTFASLRLFWPLKHRDRRPGRPKNKPLPRQGFIVVMARRAQIITPAITAESRLTRVEP